MVLPLPATARPSASNKITGGFTKYILSKTPVCPCLIEAKNKYYLNGVSITFSVIYMILFLFCGFAAKGIMDNSLNDEQYKTKTKDVENLLLNMMNDTKHCGYCVKKYSSMKNIQSMIKAELLKKEEEKLLQLVRTAYNTLAAMNIITVFIIFGGSKTITIISLFNGLLIYVSLYVSPSKAVIFETFVIVTSIVTYVRSLIGINTTMMTINTRIRLEKEP